jgi:hypothetical protein
LPSASKLFKDAAWPAPGGSGALAPRVSFAAHLRAFLEHLWIGLPDHLRDPSNANPPNKHDHRQEVTDDIIRMLEDGTWQDTFFENKQ